MLHYALLLERLALNEQSSLEKHSGIKIN